MLRYLPLREDLFAGTAAGVNAQKQAVDIPAYHASLHPAVSLGVTYRGKAASR